MPSLKVSKCKEKNTYGYFYNLLQNESPKQDDILIISTLIIFSIVIASCIYLLRMIFYNYKNIYQSYQLFYLFDWLVYVFLVFVLLLFIIHVFMNGHYNYTLKHNIIVTFIVCVLINGTIITLLVLYYNQYDNYIWYFDLLCNNVLLNNGYFQSLCKYYFSVLGLYLYACGYPFCLLLIILLNHLLWCLSNHKQNRDALTSSLNNSNSHCINYSDQSIEMADLNESLITANACESIGIRLQLARKVKHSFCLYIMFDFLFFLFVCSVHFIASILYYYKSNINHYFFYLLLSTSFFKITLKFVARKIDIINMNYNYDSTSNYNSSNKWYYYTSMEIFVEFCINFAYFIFYYYLFIFELSSADIYHVLFLIFLHLTSESCQSIIRFSKFYFDKTTLLLAKMQIHCNDENNTLWKKVLQFILNKFQDPSNLNEWRIRHSLDFSIRCVIFIFSFVLFGILLVIIPHDAWLVSHKSDYYKGISYLCLSVSCDFAYFISLCLFNYYSNHFNIWKPLTVMCTANPKVFVCLLIMSVFFAFIITA